MRKTIIATFIVLIFFTLSLFPLMVLNEGDSAYEGGGKNTPTIRKYIIEGAGYFLKSRSDLLLLLNKIELSELNGIDYLELQNIIKSVIENMENAKATYENLIAIAKETPYNESVIETLKNFDYPGFQENQGLNNEIFKEVENLLIKGDVTGVFEKFKDDLENILATMYEVKYTVDSNTFPEIAVLWEINQKYVYSLLFGQYVAVVCKNLKNIN